MEAPTLTPEHLEPKSGGDLEVEFQLEAMIPVAQLLQNPSLDQLAGQLLDQLSETQDASQAESTAATKQTEDAQQQETADLSKPSAAESLARIDEMSDEEVERMLNEMM